jgi:hypothetical protein
MAALTACNPAFPTSIPSLMQEIILGSKLSANPVLSTPSYEAVDLVMHVENRIAGIPSFAGGVTESWFERLAFLIGCGA